MSAPACVDQEHLFAPVRAQLAAEIPRARGELAVLTAQRTKLTSEMAELRAVLAQTRALEERCERALPDARRISAFRGAPALFRRGEVEDGWMKRE